ncbi:FtsX-like permease family protein [Roseivirga pacifica]|uniref:FtsX-like permease family protein n=1 Tax=Roseivirga pacifica TaxID=1267423 RepID=UPI00209538CF|nr:FtsX-like permease family protein [Roseivirga pacifica]MCO6358369.1 FtsX-like permease family protein [Roseivirga pacifica]
MHTPPKTPLKVLRWFCTDERLEEIEGDLFEAYQDWRETKTKPRANWLYWWTVIRGIPSHAKRIKISSPSLFLLMLGHYLKTAKRAIIKEKTFTAINIFGLCLGLASSLMLFLFIIEQLRKDYDLPEKEHIYRIEAISSRSPEGYITRVHPGIGPLLLESFPQVQECSVMNKLKWDVVVENEDQLNFFEEEFLIADSSFFNIFPQSFILGNKTTALNSPSKVILTESSALKYFNNTDVIGREIKIDRDRRNRFTVSAVISDPPPHSSIQFKMIIAQDIQYDITSGGYDATHLYLKLSPETQLVNFTGLMNKEISSRVSTDVMRAISYSLKSFNDLKYNLETTDEIIIPADKNLYMIFTTIALLILILALINYINITTARAIKRGHEAGIRKIIGAGKGSLISQFLVESLLTSFITLPLAIFVVEATLPYFETALSTQLSFNYLLNPVFMFSAVSIVLLVGIIAGIYPAILVAQFRFSEFLKGNLSGSQKGSTIRKVLVLIQFTLTITLIIGAVVVQRQLHLFQHKKLSYDPEQILVIDRALSQNFDLIRSDLKEIPSVILSAATSSPPGGDNYRFHTPNIGLSKLVHGLSIDHNYADLLDLEFIKGNNFNLKTPSENDEGVIINETLAKLIQAENPKNSKSPLDEKYPFMISDFKIKAIVKDFQIESLHDKIKPMVLVYESYNGYNGAYLLIKLNTSNIENTINQIEGVWTKHIPDSSFRYQFLDSRFNSLYTTEIRLGRIFQLFTAMALIVSCLGLLGFVGFLIQSKTKEIAVRKILGASIGQIINLFLKEIYFLIMLSSLVALPIAYYIMNRWLNSFAYHTNIPTWHTLIVVLGGFGIATLTVFIQTYTAANTNPVESLRRE